MDYLRDGKWPGTGGFRPRFRRDAAGRGNGQPLLLPPDRYHDWQRLHQCVLRWPMTARRILLPQTLQGSPARA